MSANPDFNKDATLQIAAGVALLNRSGLATWSQ
jgi:hypothetical protein